MRKAQRELSVDEIVDVAHAIVAMRPSQVVLTVQDLMLRRKLSRTVSALNALLADHPAHQAIAAEALARIGFRPEAPRPRA